MTDREPSVEHGYTVGEGGTPEVRAHAERMLRNPEFVKALDGSGVGEDFDAIDRALYTTPDERPLHSDAQEALARLRTNTDGK
jgi:hypothetical protein